MRIITSTATLMLLISTIAFASVVLASDQELTESCTFKLIPPLGKACEHNTCVAECRKLQSHLPPPTKCRPGAECIIGDGVCIAEGCDCMLCNHSKPADAVLLNSTSHDTPAN